MFKFFENLTEKLYEFVYNKLDPNFYFSNKLETENFDKIVNFEKHPYVFIAFLLYQNIKYFFTNK